MNSRSKTIKLAVINLLTLIIGLGLMSGSVSQRDAQAARFESIPALRVNSLGNFRGQYLSVLYVVGSRPFIATDKSQINIAQIKDSRTLYITSDSMELPAVQVEKEGFRPSYNMIVFVISPQADFGWVNADGSVPQGGLKTNNRQINLLNSVNKSDVDNFVSARGENAVLDVDILQK